MLIKQIELRNQVNSHDKFYILSVHEEGGQFLVKATWGRLGRRPNQVNQIKGGPYLSLSAAETYTENIVSSKINKGYILFREDNSGNIPHPAPTKPTVESTINKEVWTQNDIQSDPHGFSQALRAALQKGASI